MIISNLHNRVLCDLILMATGLIQLSFYNNSEWHPVSKAHFSFALMYMANFLRNFILHTDGSIILHFVARITDTTVMYINGEENSTIWPGCRVQ